MKFGAIYPHQEIGTDPVVIRDRYPRAASASDGIGCQTGCPDRFTVWALTSKLLSMMVLAMPGRTRNRSFSANNHPTLRVASGTTMRKVCRWLMANALSIMNKMPREQRGSARACGLVRVSVIA
jgi:hypothetical protein